MKVMGMTAEGATIAALEPIEVRLMTALVEVATEFVKGSGLPGPVPVPAPRVERTPRRVKKAGSAGAPRRGKDGAVPLWKLAADLLEKEQRPMRCAEIAERLKRDRKEVTDRIYSRRTEFQQTGYGTYAAKSWKPRELNREEKLLVEAAPEQLLPDAKAKRLALLKELGKKGE